MKLNYFSIKSLYTSLLIIMFSNCVNKENNTRIDYTNKEITTDNIKVAENEIEILPEASNLQTKTVKTYNTEVDSNKIYEEKEVTRAVNTQSNAEALAFCMKNFKYPNPLPKINGKVWVDLIIEKDGLISDVIIVEGLHPELDKETIRVLKLMPKFLPGKLNGQPVRSKYRMPISYSYHESK